MSKGLMVKRTSLLPTMTQSQKRQSDGLLVWVKEYGLHTKTRLDDYCVTIIELLTCMVR